VKIPCVYRGPIGTDSGFDVPVLIYPPDQPAREGFISVSWADLDRLGGVIPFGFGEVDVNFLTSGRDRLQVEFSVVDTDASTLLKVAAGSK
jgi:hypothetical protein